MQFFAVGDAPVGFIAIGGQPTGFLAIGAAPVGVISLGWMARGVVAVGQLATGVVVVGQLAFGLVVIGQLALGMLWSMGQVGVGATSGPGAILPLLGRLHLRGLFDPYASHTDRLMPDGKPPAWRIFLGTAAIAAMAVGWWLLNESWLLSMPGLIQPR